MSFESRYLATLTQLIADSTIKISRNDAISLKELLDNIANSVYETTNAIAEWCETGGRHYIADSIVEHLSDFSETERSKGGTPLSLDIEFDDDDNDSDCDRSSENSDKNACEDDDVSRVKALKDVTENIIELLSRG